MMASRTQLLSTFLRRFLNRWFRFRREQRVRILSTAQEAIDAIVKMVRRAARIAGISNIPKNCARLHDASCFYVTKPVQMSIVMPRPAGTKDANDVAYKVVFANFEDYS